MIDLDETAQHLVPVRQLELLLQQPSRLVRDTEPFLELPC